MNTFRTILYFWAIACAMLVLVGVFTMLPSPYGFVVFFFVAATFAGWLWSIIGVSP